MEAWANVKKVENLSDVQLALGVREPRMGLENEEKFAEG
jgi:hypothetical protein